MNQQSSGGDWHSQMMRRKTQSTWSLNAANSLVWFCREVSVAVEYTQFESSPRRSKLPVNVSFSVRWCQLTQQSARQKRKRNLQCARWNWKPSENRRQNPEDNGCWDSSRKVSQWLKQRMDKVALAKVIAFHSHSSSSWLILFHSFRRRNLKFPAMIRFSLFRFESQSYS